MPNLRHLYAVPEIARRGSLSAAAASQHLSQSALTQALRSLERQAGQRLFERSGRGMVPTAAGRILVARVNRALDCLRAGERGVPGPRFRASRLTAAQLHALVAVVETGGFSLAARRLGRAQPSVYRAAKAVEALCGEPLFRPTRSGVEPSGRARRLARHASLALAEIRHAFEEIGELAGRWQSRIRVGSLPLARAGILPDAVNAMLRRYPELTVSIIDGPYEELLHALRHGSLDLLIGALRDPTPTGDVVQETLFSDPLAILVRAGHPMLRSASRDPARLARLHWIVPRRGTPARDYFHAYFAAHGVATPRRLVECSSLVATRGLLLGSDSAALLSARQVRLEIAAGHLALLLDPLPGTQRPIGLTVRRDWQPTPVLREFLAEVRRAAAA